MCDYRFFIRFFETIRTIFGKLVVWKSYTPIFNAKKSGSLNDEIKLLISHALPYSLFSSVQLIE